MKYSITAPAFLFLILLMIPFNNELAQTFTSSNLPIVTINTHGQQIVDDPKIAADMNIIFNGEGSITYLTDTVYDYKGYIGIEIRGSSSQMFPKKQYAVETRSSTGDDSTVSLLGFPKQTDWILYAAYDDKTLIRDVLSYKLSRDMGRYASRSHYCELVLNGEYMGVYILLEKIKRDKNRVNISKIEAVTSGDSLTGGYIIKIDKPDGIPNEDWFSSYAPFSGATQKIRYVHHYPKPEDITPVQHNYIRGFIEAFESCMYSTSYNDPVNGYSKYIDVDLFVDYFLQNEVTKNVDAYRISAYMYKDRDSKGGKLFMGPVWDYNIALGNSDYYDAWKKDGWHINFLTTNSSFMSGDQFQVPFWWKKLFNDPGFRNKVRGRWEQLKGNVFRREAIFNYIDSTAAAINSAQARNFQRWPILGVYVWPNYFVGQTYQQEIDFMKQWIRDRLTWLDANMIGELTSIQDKPQTPLTFKLQQNYPNPFNPSTVISYSIPHRADVELKVYDITGREAAVLVNEVKEAGKYEVSFNSEDARINLASGVYFYILRAGSNIISKKMILLK